MPEHEIADYLRQSQGDELEAPFEVYAENWRAVQIFCSLATQWRYLPRPDAPPLTLGLDYGAAMAVIAAHNPRRPARLLEKLRVMEYAVLESRADD